MQVDAFVLKLDMPSLTVGLLYVQVDAFAAEVGHAFLTVGPLPV